MLDYLDGGLPTGMTQSAGGLASNKAMRRSGAPGQPGSRGGQEALTADDSLLGREKRKRKVRGIPPPPFSLSPSLSAPPFSPHARSLVRPSLRPMDAPLCVPACLHEC
jgi:hypothetical protein